VLLALVGCGLPASTRAALRQPESLTFLAVPPSEVSNHPGDDELRRNSESRALTVPFTPFGLLLLPLLPAMDAADASRVTGHTRVTVLGLDDPGVALAAAITAHLQSRGYAQPQALEAQPVRYRVRPDKLPEQIGRLVKTPWVLHLQLNDLDLRRRPVPRSLSAVLSLFDDRGRVAYQRRCAQAPTEAERVADTGEAAQAAWVQLVARCADELVVDF
jgi:hypothetical protein